MQNNLLINQLLLAFSPICNYDFEQLKSDPDVQNCLLSSSLYVIAQRPVLSFENIIPNFEEAELYFEIHQRGNPSILKCTLPLFQEHLAQDPSAEYNLWMGSNDDSWSQKSPPFTNVHGIKFYQGKEDFLVFFSPEKFLHNYWRGWFTAEIEGNIRDFTTYKLHYVGESTKQDIWKRLTGHEKLQKVLGTEYPLNFGDLPTHEIVILCFKFQDNLSIRSFDENSSTQDMVDSFLGLDYPDQSTVFLDAEKALVHAMRPEYNEVEYKSYPKSANGLYSSKFDVFLYTFMDPITLSYKTGEINGDPNHFGGDVIRVIKDKGLEILKK